MTKVCNDCGIEKDLKEFENRRTAKDGHRNDCRSCANLYRKEYYKTHKEIVLKQRANQSKRIKDLVFNHYGWKCSCCGETEISFLTIDHIKGGGNKHRKETNGHTYRWLVRNNFPEGFRTLCMNCQFGYKWLGYCPHHPEGKT